MYKILQHLHTNDLSMSFLFPGLANRPMVGKVEAIEAEKATLLVTIENTPVRIVTHPNSVILIERES